MSWIIGETEVGQVGGGAGGRVGQVGISCRRVGDGSIAKHLRARRSRIASWRGLALEHMSNQRRRGRRRASRAVLIAVNIEILPEGSRRCFLISWLTQTFRAGEEIRLTAGDAETPEEKHLVLSAICCGIRCRTGSGRISRGVSVGPS